MRAGRRADCACPPAACIPTAFRWCARCSTWTKSDLDASIATSWAATLGEALLAPTRIYVKPVLTLMEQRDGQGRVATSPAAASMRTSRAALPEGLTRAHRDARRASSAHLRSDRQSAGDIPERDMFNTFNMGVGMMPDRRRRSEADRGACASCTRAGEDAVRASARSSQRRRAGAML